MRKLMKSILAVLVLVTPLVLSSCEGALDDLLGEWSRPTPGSSPGGGSGSGTVTAATITTAPTATAGDILDGSTTALVTAGVADGGTIMYKATSNTESKPTSTDGFSAEIPTAATNTVGTYFVWYYAKAADAQHSDSEIAATPVEVTVQPSLATPLTIEAISAGKITVTSPQANMKFSKNGAAKTSVGITSIEVSAGDKVAFYGTDASYNGTTIGGADDGGVFKCKVYGNIMSLLYEDFATNYTALPAGTETFKDLFYSNVKLTDASGLLLPATTLTTYCYCEMFMNCTSLTAAPKNLPAKTLNDYCYQLMFYGCTSLTTAPAELPATTLKQYCYNAMFYNCSTLTTTPKLPATALVEGCYQGMFISCTSLTTAYVKATYTDSNYECTNMFNGCTKTDGTFYCVDAATANAWISTFNGFYSTYLKDWTGAVYP